MTQTMVERVARAIYEEMGRIMTEDGSKPDDWDDFGMEHDLARAQWRKTALAALRALREPTEAMLNGHVSSSMFNRGGVSMEMDDTLLQAYKLSVAKNYRAMISAAIQEAETE